VEEALAGNRKCHSKRHAGGGVIGRSASEA